MASALEAAKKVRDHTNEHKQWILQQENDLQTSLRAIGTEILASEKEFGGVDVTSISDRMRLFRAIALEGRQEISKIGSTIQAGYVKTQEDLNVLRRELKGKLKQTVKRVDHILQHDLSEKQEIVDEHKATLEELQDEYERLMVAKEVALNVARAKFNTTQFEVNAQRVLCNARIARENPKNCQVLMNELQVAQAFLDSITNEKFLNDRSIKPEIFEGWQIGQSTLDGLREETEQLRSSVVRLLGDLSELKLLSMQTKAHQSEDKMSALERAHISRPPKIQIFEQKPPPEFRSTDGVTPSIRTFQEFVARQYAMFKWESETPMVNLCMATREQKLTNWQRFVYHYFHPYQSEVPGMLMVASAGAGKSWMIALLASIWARSGAAITMVTKDTLRADLVRAMFVNMADVNINNLVNGEHQPLGTVKDKKTSKSIPKPETPPAISGNRKVRVQARIKANREKGETSTAEAKMEEERRALVEANGFFALKEMGVKWVTAKTTTDFVMSVEQLSRMLFIYNGVNFVAAGRGGTEEYPLKRAVILIDEIHRLVTSPGSDMTEAKLINYISFMDELLRHRDALPKEDWPVVMGFTATPISEYACDIVKLLNLKVGRDRVWGLKDEDDWIRGDRKEDNDRFLDLYFDESGRMNAKGLKKWERLSAGLISNLSVYGDRAHFAQKVFHVSEVTLSKVQTKGALCALKYQTGKLAGVDCGKKDATKVLSVEKAKEKALEAVLSPLSDKVVSGVPKGEMLDFAVENVPNIAQILQLLQKNDKKDKAKFTASNYSHAKSGGSDVGRRNANKIYLYIPSKEKRATTVIFKLLEEMGYYPLNIETAKSMTISTKSRPYRYFIDHTRDSKEKFHSTDARFSAFNGQKYNNAMRGIFNAERNYDGQDALILVSSSAFREGISLALVKKVYIVGTELTKANLLQAILRAVRYCSSNGKDNKGLEWKENKGWEIDVYLQLQKWHHEILAKNSDSDVLRESFTQTIKATNPQGEKFYLAMETMQKLMEGSAVDLPLFGAMGRQDTTVDLV